MVPFYRVSAASRRLDFPPVGGVSKKYVIASQPRSGSHLLAQILYRTGKAGCPLEYFHPRHWRDWVARCKRDAPERVVASIMRRRTSQNGVFGVKAHWHQFARAIEMELECFLQDARFLYITRNDILGQAISLEIATQSSQWVSGHKRIHEPHYSYEQIWKGIETILWQRAKWDRFFAGTGIEPFRLTYEELDSDRLRRVASVLAFLEIDDTEISIDPDPICVQRSDLNRQWRQRFLQEASENDYDNPWKRASRLLDNPRDLDA